MRRTAVLPARAVVQPAKTEPAPGGQTPRGLSLSARVYLAFAYAAALAASVYALVTIRPTLNGDQLAAYVLLIALASAAQLLKVDAPGRQSYHTTPIFLLAAALLLPPPAVIAMVPLVLSLEWLRYRYPWYIQAFNVSTYLLSALTAWAVFDSVAGDVSLGPSWRSAAATALAATAFASLNHAMVGLVLWLARGLSPRQSRVFSLESLQTDLALLSVGAGLAVFWVVNPGLIVLGLIPLFPFYRALFVPKLQEEAYLDAKTGLLTARRFLELLNEELARLAKAPRPTAVVMADPDLLRNINNSLGHLAGDRVIAAVANVLQATAADSALIGRFGGEEFALLLPNCDLERAGVLAESIRATLEATSIHVDGSPEPACITMSLGVAAFPHPCDDPARLLHYADLAVYRSKLLGRNRVSLASPEMDDKRFPESGFRATLESLIFALDARGVGADGHTLRVTALALAIAADLGIAEGSARWNDIERASLVHDVGKIAVPSEVLYKSGTLTSEEWEQVRQHPELGWAMLQPLPPLRGAADIVRAHHEHFDGSGYPRGLKGEEIPLGARIFAVADAFDAITTDRPYRDARSEAVAVEEIVRNSGSQFDPEVVASLKRVVGYGGRDQS